MPTDQGSGVAPGGPVIAQPPAAPEAIVAPPPVVVPSAEEVNAAEYTGGPLPEGLSAITLKLQIILDELGMSPGVIDGVNGRNVAKAIAGAEALAGLPIDGILDAQLWQRLPRNALILVDYEITSEDVAGPFLPRFPPTTPRWRN